MLAISNKVDVAAKDFLFLNELLDGLLGRSEDTGCSDGVWRNAPDNDRLGICQLPARSQYTGPRRGQRRQRPSITAAGAFVDDLMEIARYIAKRNLSAAERFIDSVHETGELVASQPEMGRARDELAPGLRSFPIGAFVLFYRPAQQRSRPCALRRRGFVV
jgi:plasmid stabilization system protein ParE